MIAMQSMQDNQYDIAIVDPPYGVTKGMIGGIDKIVQNNAKQDIYTKKDWNIAPPDEYFIELQRVSKHQIIWGGNYFPVLWREPARGFIVWDKRTIGKLHADCELAWTSYDRNARIFNYRWSGAHTEVGLCEGRIHPTEKPAALYRWIFDQFVDKTDKILDTHLGSGSIAVAAHDMGISLDAYEIDKEYYENAKARLEEHQRQIRLF